MPSQTFALALKGKLMRQQRLRESRRREAWARERVVAHLLQYAAYVYGLYAVKPPPEMRHELLREANKPNGAYRWLIDWVKQNGMPVASSRDQPIARARAQEDPPVEHAFDGQEPVLVKRYAGRRFFDTARCCYVSRDEVAAMIRNSRTVVVKDAKTGEDVTSDV